MDGHNKVKVVGKAMAHGTGRGSVDFLYGIPRALANANPYPTVPFAPRPSPQEQKAYEQVLGKMDRSVEKWKDVAFPQPMYTDDPSAQLWSDSALAISEAVASTGGPMASARMVTGGAKLAAEGGRALAKGVDYAAAYSAMRPGYITITYPEWLRNLKNGTRSVAEVLPNTADLLKTVDGEKLPLFVMRNGNLGYSRELNDMVTRWRNLSRNPDVTPGQQKIYREMSDFFAERLKTGGTAEAANKATLEKYGYQANIGGSLNATIASSVEKTSQSAMRKGLGVKSGTVYPARGENLNYDQLPSDIVPMVYEHLKTKGADVPINIGGVEFMVFRAGSRGSRPNFWNARSPGAAAARSGMTADAPTVSSFHLVSKERLGSQDGQYIVMTLTDHGVKGVSDISTMDEGNVRKFISTITGDNGFQVPGGTVGKTGATVPGPVIHVGSRPADNLILETEAGAKALNDVDDIFGPRVGGQETRQDAKGGRKSNSQLALFLATDDVPPTLFGIPVVQSEADYSEKDLAFFQEHPEAGGYYSMGEDEPQDSKGTGPQQTAAKGGRSMQTAVRKAPASRISEEAVAAVIPFIKSHEKFVAKAYRTKLGVDKKTGAPIYDKWTLGYGQTEINGRPVRPGDVIDEPSASRYVEQKVRQVADELHRSAGWLGGASAKATAAMYDLAYNMGPGGLSAERSPMLHRTASAARTMRDVDAAIWAQVPTYVRAGGQVLQGLVNRRNDSLELWGPKPERVASATAETAGGTEI